MANCHELFLKYYKEIQLTESKIDLLKQARAALRARITQYFESNNRMPPPKYCGQGSLSMGTIINPANGEYDIDDGIYLQNLSDNIQDWPTPGTVHGWVYDAVDGHTNTPPIDKNTCVRVIYKSEYHVDLPIYAKVGEMNYHAHKKKGWKVSNPVQLVEWFNGKIEISGDQLRRMVCYLKSWADLLSPRYTVLNGLIITVLTCELFESSGNEDIAFSILTKNFYDRLMNNTFLQNPIDNNENLLEKYDTSQIQEIVGTLKSIYLSANSAISTDDKNEACNIWSNVFGVRWPDCSSIENNKSPRKTERPALLKNDGRSA